MSKIYFQYIENKIYMTDIYTENKWNLLTNVTDKLYDK